LKGNPRSTTISITLEDQRDADSFEADSEALVLMRKVSGLGLLLVAISAGLTFTVSCGGENPLIGSWRWDNAKTLANFRLPTEGSDELKQSADKAKRLVEGIAAKAHSNMVLTYRDSECEEVIFTQTGQVLSRETIPYRLVKVEKTVVIIDQKENGGIVKLFRDGNDSLYVEVQVGSYTYRDYFTREK
jgi:hypothetical protein